MLISLDMVLVRVTLFYSGMVSTKSECTDTYVTFLNDIEVSI